MIATWGLALISGAMCASWDVPIIVSVPCVWPSDAIACHFPREVAWSHATRSAVHRHGCDVQAHDRVRGPAADCVGLERGRRRRRESRALQLLHGDHA